MATIKDVAKLAGVSVTTVSLIINGKAEARKISSETKKKVLEAMSQIGYQPNLSARRLRFREEKRFAIAFYWPVDYRTNILSSFLNLMQKELSGSGIDCELIIQPYENNHLERVSSPIIKSSYSGVIIGAASGADIEYLETLVPQIPIVLINRSSKKYSTVCIDFMETGLQAARLFRQKGYTEVAIIASERSYVATGLRTQAFMKACSELGINVESQYFFRGQGTISGGVSAAEDYCQADNPPKAIFFESDAMAIGSLYTFKKHGLRIPEDIEILSIAMLDQEHTRYTTPPLSVIEMPNESVSREAVSMLIRAIENNSLEPAHVSIEPRVILRESFH